jgi:hypothetical protein
VRNTAQAWRGRPRLRIAHVRSIIGTPARRQAARSPVAARTLQSAAHPGYSGSTSATAPGNGEGQPDAGREARRAARSERRDAPAERPGVMIPSGRKRLPLEAPLMRVVATGGIVGIGVVIAAIMTSQDSEGWLIGLVVSIVSVVLAAVLWSSRRL